MKNVKEFIFLSLFVLSIGLLVMTPIEIYKTIEARSWVPVDVIVISSQIDENHGHYLKIEILDIEKGETNSRVSLRYGDIHLSVEVFGSLFISTLYADRARYPVGAKIKAFRSPDQSIYVLEQNTINQMLVLLLLACIYPGVTIWSIVTNRSNPG